MLAVGGGQIVYSALSVPPFIMGPGEKKTERTKEEIENGMYRYRIIRKKNRKKVRRPSPVGITLTLQ